MPDGSTVPAGQRFLVYQPNHGLGMEMALVDMAVRLGRLLDRTVVLPLLPLLETLEYQGGIDEYFELQPETNWISTAEFRARHGGVIDHLFHLWPHWRPEYDRQIVRDLHPVWLRNISHYEYFARAEIAIRARSQHVFHEPLDAAAAQREFASEARTIGFSYINGLLGETSPEPPPDDDFRWLTWAPPHPRKEILRYVEEILGGVPGIAMHVRRANLDMARRISGTVLPAIPDFYARVPPGAGIAYVATDVDSVFGEVSAALPDARRIRTGHFTRDAVIDIAACALAKRFIGTHCSTFTMYIVHARASLGHEASSAFLLK